MQGISEYKREKKRRTEIKTTKATVIKLKLKYSSV